MELEHVIPVSQGGLTTADNLALACHGCNNYKQARTMGYKLEGLLEKNQVAMLTAIEQEELESISELDRISKFFAGCPKMSSINEFTKKLVRNRSDGLCEYCHSPEKIRFYSRSSTAPIVRWIGY
jgi:HNH endonuclease